MGNLLTIKVTFSIDIQKNNGISQIFIMPHVGKLLADLEMK